MEIFTGMEGRVVGNSERELGMSRENGGGIAGGW